MVGREADRQDLMPCVGEAEAHPRVWIQRRRKEPGRRGEGRGPGRRNFKALWSKGQTQESHDKMKMTGDFEPHLMPTSVQGINICAEQCV